jgi:cysteine synthase A
MQTFNLFFGTDFLNPENILSPLIELPNSLNPFREQKVRIFAKMLSLMPLLNSKMLAAANMLMEANLSGELKGVHTLVENSSGNMALSLAILAPNYWIENVVCFVPRDIAPGKLEVLRLAGVDVRYASTKPGSPSGITLAKELGEQPGWWCPKQYESNSNSRAYEKWLAPQIWQQTYGKMTIFSAGIGTGGTVTGVSHYIRKVSCSVAIVGVTPTTDHIPGVRTLDRLKEIKINWQESINYHLQVTAYNAFLSSRKLVKKGIFGGPSSGLALSGTLQFIQNQVKRNTLNSFRNGDGEVVAVFVCTDTHVPYLDKYSTHLHPEDLEYQI